MDPVLAGLVGMLQGVTEWLPISSSGHTLLSLEVGGMAKGTALSLVFFLHLGTLLAVLVRLRSDVADVLRALPRWRSDRLVQFLVVTTAISLPVGLALYLFLKETFVEHSFGGPAVGVLVGLLLIVTGVVLYSSRGRGGDREVGSTGPKDWTVLGLVQGLAALPGISRSGMTVSALLMGRVEAREALRLSFLMSIPVTIAAVAYQAVFESVIDIGVAAIVAGVLGAFVVGYATIEGLLSIAGRARWDWFCVGFGIVAVVAGIALILL